MKVELVTNLKRQATKNLADLLLTKELVLVTEHGLPSAYLVDVLDDEFMQRRLLLLEGLSSGELAVFEGRIFTQNESKANMSKWLKQSGLIQRYNSCMASCNGGMKSELHWLCYLTVPVNRCYF